MQRPTGEVFKQADQLVRRALEGAPGAHAGLRAKLSHQFSAEFALQRRARNLRIQAAAGCAVAAAVLLLVFLNLDWFRATVNEGSPPIVSANDNPAAPVAPRPGSLPQNTVKPDGAENTPAQNDQPGPAQPQQLVQEPKPAPEQKPPTPEPAKEPQPAPGPGVEQPKTPQEAAPTPPKGTESTPTPAKAVVARLDANAGKVRIRYGTDDWADLAANTDILAGANLSVSRGTAEVWLSGGSLLRFDGDIVLNTQDKHLLVQLESKSVYADNLGTSEALAFSVGELVAALPNGVAIARRDQAALELTCLLGDCTLGEEAVAPGFERRLTARGLGNAKKASPNRLTRDLPARVVYREDFDRTPPGGLYGDGEEMKDGLLSRTGAGNYAAFRYDPTVTVLAGMVLRFRARTRAITQLQLEVFLDKPNDQRCFSQRLKPAKEGEWQVFEIRLADFADKLNPALKMTPGQLLRNFKLHLEGTAAASVEIDWVEYVRIQED
ncbi:MAG: hypothetical protein IPP14_10420 [Planctomycetes bacterium]|nr:hypothetical protein [Planctomycetota bacterium]